jgi:hypothetical protein
LKKEIKEKEDLKQEVAILRQSLLHQNDEIVSLRVCEYTNLITKIGLANSRNPSKSCIPIKL